MPKRPPGSGGMYKALIHSDHIIRAEWHIPTLY